VVRHNQLIIAGRESMEKSTDFCENAANFLIQKVTKNSPQGDLSPEGRNG
jgi:hypothetical protein